MPAAVECFDVVTTSHEIARAADADRKGMGRPCRLQDVSAVQTFLTALLDGRSLTAASIAAGFSEGAVRRWLQLAPGSTSVGVYAQFKTTIDAVAEQRQAAARARIAEEPQPLAPLQAVVAGNVTPPARPEIRSAAAPPEPTIDPYTIWSWHLRSERAALCVVPMEAKALRNEVAGELLAAGLRTPPPRPALLLPRGLPLERVHQMYREWIRMTYQEMPIDCLFDSRAGSWYQEHQAPVTGVPSA